MKIIGRKRKRRSIWITVDLYEVCLSYIIHFPLFYFMTILTPFPPTRFVISLSLGERSSEIIGQKDLIRKGKRRHMNGGGLSC